MNELKAVYWHVLRNYLMCDYVESHQQQHHHHRRRHARELLQDATRNKTKKNERHQRSICFFDKFLFQIDQIFSLVLKYTYNRTIEDILVFHQKCRFDRSFTCVWFFFEIKQWWSSRVDRKKEMRLKGKEKSSKPMCNEKKKLVLFFFPSSPPPLSICLQVMYWIIENERRKRIWTNVRLIWNQ